MRGKLGRTLGLLEALKRDLPNAGAYAPALYLEGTQFLVAAVLRLIARICFFYRPCDVACE